MWSLVFDQSELVRLKNRLGDAVQELSHIRWRDGDVTGAPLAPAVEALAAGSVAARRQLATALEAIGRRVGSYQGAIAACEAATTTAITGER